MQVLVDGDILVYRAAFATEYPLYRVLYGDDGDYAKEFQYKKEATAFQKELKDKPSALEVDTILEPVSHALHVVDSLLTSVYRRYGGHHKLVLTGTGNFRETIAITKPYKGNRKKPKPVHYEAVRDHLVFVHGALVIDGEEADDWLGYNQYREWEINEEDTESVIVTIDKDLDMIPGLHYNFVTEEEYFVTAEEADRFFFQQLLSGDPTDNIPGLRGIGEAKARGFVEDKTPSECLAIACDMYEEQYGPIWQEVLEEQANLLWIRREPDQHWIEAFPDLEDIIPEYERRVVND